MALDAVRLTDGQVSVSRTLGFIVLYHIVELLCQPEINICLRVLRRRTDGGFAPPGPLRGNVPPPQDICIKVKGGKILIKLSGFGPVAFGGRG